MVSSTTAAALLAVLAAFAGQAAVHAGEHDDRPMSATVIGSQSPLLARGADALAAGRAEEGIRLTLEGLKRAGPVRDIAAGRANLCAGYMLLGRYAAALAECDASIALDHANWRAYNNRAAALAALGLYQRALEDIAAGLKLAPGSTVLQRSREIIRRNERLQHHRGVRSDA